MLIIQLEGKAHSLATVLDLTSVQSLKFTGGKYRRFLTFFVTISLGEEEIWIICTVHQCQNQGICGAVHLSASFLFFHSSCLIIVISITIYTLIFYTYLSSFALIFFFCFLLHILLHFFYDCFLKFLHHVFFHLFPSCYRRFVDLWLQFQACDYLLLCDVWTSMSTFVMRMLGKSRICEAELCCNLFKTVIVSVVT